jgi:hypothetical protein
MCFFFSTKTGGEVSTIIKFREETDTHTSRTVSFHRRNEPHTSGDYRRGTLQTWEVLYETISVE